MILFIRFCLGFVLACLCRDVFSAATDVVIPKGNIKCMIFNTNESIIKISSKKTDGKPSGDINIKYTSIKIPDGKKVKITPGIKSVICKSKSGIFSDKDQKWKVNYDVVLPSGEYYIKIIGDNVTVNLDGVDGSIYVQAGKIDLKSSGGRTTSVKGAVGSADISIDKMAGPFAIAAGTCNAKVTYDLSELRAAVEKSDKKKPVGLSLKKKYHAFSLSCGSGTCEAILPPDANVWYKSFGDVDSDFPNKKEDSEVRISVSSPSCPLSIKKYKK